MGKGREERVREMKVRKYRSPSNFNGNFTLVVVTIRQKR